MKLVVLSILSAINTLLVESFALIFQIWKRVFSPLFGVRCRFEPTCSRYAIEALRKYGFLRGNWLIIRRVLRCNPLCEGGVDPVP